jgi:exopolyphosphatase/pppGpp-phosphohydrolase
MKFAAIDIGTNAARLLIGDVSMTAAGVQIQKQGYYRSPLRLGEDVFNKGKISAAKLKQSNDAGFPITRHCTPGYKYEGGSYLSHA